VCGAAVRVPATPVGDDERLRGAERATVERERVS